MSWNADSGAAFSGGSGQMAVIGELLHRKCNAAIPHVDVGTDVFAFRDDCEDVARIQVKTAPGKRYKDGPGYAAKFGIPMKQLERTDEPPLFYALAVRLDDGWGRFVVIGRQASRAVGRGLRFGKQQIGRPGVVHSVSARERGRARTEGFLRDVRFDGSHQRLGKPTTVEGSRSH